MSSRGARKLAPERPGEDTPRPAPSRPWFRPLLCGGVLAGAASTTVALGTGSRHSRDRNTDPRPAAAVCRAASAVRDLVQRSLRRLPGPSRATGTIAARPGLTSSWSSSTAVSQRGDDLTKSRSGRCRAGRPSRRRPSSRWDELARADRLVVAQRGQHARARGCKRLSRIATAAARGTKVAFALPGFVHVSSERARQAVRQGCSFAKKQASPVGSWPSSEAGAYPALACSLASTPKASVPPIVEPEHSPRRQALPRRRDAAG